MSRIRAALAIALCGYGLALPGAAPSAAELRDDRGVNVRLAAPAARIVTLAPHLAEIVFAAGAEEKLVGVARFSDHPVRARQLPQVGDASRIDIERVLLLRPDLVLAWKTGNQPGDVQTLERLGVPVFVTEPVRLPDVSRLIRSVGVLAGTARGAEEAAALFEAEIGALRGRFSTRRAIRVFYEIWHRPLLTINGSHMISDVIRLCGGFNVFAAARMLTPTVSVEAVLAAQPEAIVGGGSGISAHDFEAKWRSHRVPALQKLGLIHVAPDEIQRASPRIAAGARTVCEGLDEFRARRR